MIYKKLYRTVERQLHMEGSEVREMIKDYIQDSIKDFVQMSNWKMVKVSETITSDGSGRISLSSLDNYFAGELELYSGTTNYEKVDYETYLSMTNKTLVYSIFGNYLYIDGTNTDYTFLYKTYGYKYHNIAITGIAGNIITVSGDQSDYLRGKTELNIDSSTGNDGDYSISSYQVTGGNTEITVSIALPDTTVDGNVRIKRDGFLEFDTDENIITENYDDVIIKMTVYKFVNYLGDHNEILKEQNLLNMKLTALKKSENRTEKEGMPNIVRR